MRTRTVTNFLNTEVKEYAEDILKNRCITFVYRFF